MWSSAYSDGVRASMTASKCLKSIEAYYNVAGPDVHPPAPHLRELPFACRDDRLRAFARPSRARRAIGKSRRCGARPPPRRAPPLLSLPRSDPMNRRLFLKSATAAAIAQSFAWRAAFAEQGWRTFETVTRVEVKDSFGIARAWVPLPLEMDTSWQKALGNSWSGNATTARVMHDGKYGISMLYAEWTDKEMNPAIEVTSRFMTRDRGTDLSRPDKSIDLSAGHRTFFTAPTDLIQTDGIVRKMALDITKGAKTDVDKARAIYEWIVDNTFRDPKTRGCGVGDVKSLLESGNLGGKWADLNALDAGPPRSVGGPARDLYGVRVAPCKYGYQRL